MTRGPIDDQVVAESHFATGPTADSPPRPRTVAQRRAATQDLQGAYRALLDQFAVLASDNPEMFRMIFVRQREIRTWFYDVAGWWLTVTGECAHLTKYPATVYAWHGFDTDDERPLQGPLDYELIVWALWYGERKPLDHTFLIGTLATDIADETRPFVGAGHIDWNRRDHRDSLVRALRGLEKIGALRRLDGESEWFARDGIDADIVYEFTPIARVMRAQPAAELLPDGMTINTAAHERPLTTRQRVYRHLLTTPALLAEFDQSGFDLLLQQEIRIDIATDLDAHLGWPLEVTASYAALLRHREPGAQPAFPTGHVVSRIALLMCQHFRTAVETRTRGSTSFHPDGFDRLIMPRERFQSELGRVKQKYDKWWGSTTRERSLGGLADDVLACLRNWGLASGPAADDQIMIYATAARFSAIYTDDDSGLTDDGDDE